MNTDKYSELLKEYSNILNLTDKEVKENVDKILTENVTKNSNTETYKTIFGLLDLTSLNNNDTEAHISALTTKVNKLPFTFEKIPNIAAICIYPALVSTVKNTLTANDVEIASVAAGFPSPQTFIEVKVAETAMAVMEGATEIDMVFPIDKFLEKDYQEVCEQIMEIKASCRSAKLKVILETGTLKTPENIAKATLFSIASGADFVKTSTGKNGQGATPEAAYIMCKVIKEFENRTKTKIGFKAAGGIATIDDAVKYYSIVKNTLGNDYLQKNLFRIGTSRLANMLISEIYGKEENYF